MTATVEIHGAVVEEAKGGQFKVRLVNVRNGETIFVSELYHDKRDALAAAEASGFPVTDRTEKEAAV